MENTLLIFIRVLLSAIMPDGIMTTETTGLTENSYSVIVQYGDLSFSSDRILKTAPELFRLMNFDLLESDQDPEDFTQGVILPLKSKQVLFGNESALGKILLVDSFFYRVIGVVKDVPEKSCLDCDLIILSSDIKVPFEKLANIRFSIIY